MRFDHAVIGVPGLAEAVTAYTRLGFAVSPGGRHTGEGTHNAIVRFGLQYLELMAVHDEALARSRPFGVQLLELLSSGGGGLIGYVVAGDPDAPAAALCRAGQAPVGPVAMQRERADGKVLRWRLLFPRGQRWRDVAPFVIEWGTPDAARAAWDDPVAHPNGVTAVAALEVRTPDLAATIALYAALGLDVERRAADRARVALAGVPVDLVAGGDAEGAGLWELTLQVDDLARPLAVIPGLADAGDGRLVIPREAALGARLALVEVSAPRG